MRLLLDMNLPPALALWLRGDRHDAVRLHELGLSSLPDRDLLARGAAEDRIVITFDLEFDDIVGSASGTGPGVVLLRLRSPRQAHLRNRVRTALSLTEKTLETGAIVLVEDSRIRVRTLRSDTDTIV